MSGSMEVGAYLAEAGAAEEWRLSKTSHILRSSLTST